MSMKFISLFLLICCLFSNSFSNSFNLKTGMTEDEILEAVNGKLLSGDHSLWRSPMIIQELGFINRDNLRLVQIKNGGREYCLVIELDQCNTLKNLFYIPLNDLWATCKATFVGDYWKTFNRIRIGDDYDDVIKLVGQKSSSDFFVLQVFGTSVMSITLRISINSCFFFAATGKVAHIESVDPGYVNYRSIEHEDGSLEFIH